MSSRGAYTKMVMSLLMKINQQVYDEPSRKQAKAMFATYSASR